MRTRNTVCRVNSTHLSLYTHILCYHSRDARRDDMRLVTLHGDHWRWGANLLPRLHPQMQVRREPFMSNCTFITQASCSIRLPEHTRIIAGTSGPSKREREWAGVGGWYTLECSIASPHIQATRPGYEIINLLDTSVSLGMRLAACKPDPTQTVPRQILTVILHRVFVTSHEYC